MSAQKNCTATIIFRTTPEIREHLGRHSKRLGEHMTSLVLQATIAHLRLLDEQEAAAIEHKRRRKQAFVPSTPQHRHNEIPSLRKRKMMQSKQPPISFSSPEHIKISDKLERGFRRWAEYIEEAEDRIDADRRAKVVLDEMRDRATSEVEVTACFDQFKDFLSERKSAREKPAHVVDIDSVPFIAGDIAD